MFERGQRVLAFQCFQQGLSQTFRYNNRECRVIAKYQYNETRRRK